jgi:hypothetical protein
MPGLAIVHRIHRRDHLRELALLVARVRPRDVGRVAVILRAGVDEK